MSNTTFDEIARSCSIADALMITGLSLRNSRGSVVEPPSDKGTYRSPFRQESNPSFSVFRDRADRHWCFKDQATGEGGNMINFVKNGCSLDSNGAAAELIDKELRLGLFKKPRAKSARSNPDGLRNMKLDDFSPLHAEQIAAAVGVKGTEGISRIFNRGILGAGTLFRFGKNGSYPEPNCFFLYDKNTNSATSRKLSGEKFGALKSVCPNDWHKRPIGVSSIHPKAIYGEVDDAVFCEGEKDLIAVMHGISYDRAIPICMPSVTTTLLPEHAEKFANMTCTIYAQADRPGITAALQWFEWLQPYAFSVCIRVPKALGDDWADLGAGCTSSEMELLLSAGEVFDVYIDEDILTLSPDAFPKEKAEPIKAKKRGGSPLNVDNMHRVWEAWNSLPDSRKESVADVCKVLGVETRGKENSKVVRGLNACFIRLYGECLRLRYCPRVSADPIACNYSEQVA